MINQQYSSAGIAAVHLHIQHTEVITTTVLGHTKQFIYRRGPVCLKKKKFGHKYVEKIFI